MRLAPALLLLLAAPALAQNPIPDTTAAWRYFPLEVGNVWEYLCSGGTDFAGERRAIVGDTTISGERYFRYRIERFDADGQHHNPPETAIIRFDTLSATLDFDEQLVPPFGVTPCPLDAPFGDELDCDGGLWARTLTSGGIETLTIGTDVVQTTVKGYDCGACEQAPEYAAGIGLAHLGFLGSSGGATCELAYARVGGMEYGDPIVLSAEPSSPSSVFAVKAYPNPTRGVATLGLTVSAPQSVAVEVFDVLGRRVYREVHAAAGTTLLPLDGRAWKPGVYVVRVAGTEGEATTTRIVRR